MASSPLGVLLRHIHKLAGDPPNSARRLTDRQLLDQFTQRQSEAAFSALVARHGPMVLRVCRRVLNHEQDAEDAFQASFLVLARKTASIRKRDTIGDWLHGVAYRTAMHVKRSAARRRKHEQRAALGRGQETPPQRSSPTWDDVQAVLDEEIQRLPACFREAFVLCVLEGKSGPEAAAELRCKEGTVKSRVNRARRALQRQLARRGINLAVLLAALSVAESATHAALPAALVQTTIRFGLSVAAGNPAAGVIPSHIAALAAGVTRAMLVTKTKIAVVALLVSGLLAACGFALTDASAKPQATTDNQPQATAKPQAAENDRAVDVTGRVVDPDGRPVKGAKLVFVYPLADAAAAKVWATSSPDGGFHFTVAESLEAVNPWSVWDSAFVVAAADGYGFAWAQVRPESAGNLTLHLVKDDLPIQGRILDLQGKPIQGVTVRIDNEVTVPTKGDLTSWLRANQQDEGQTTAHDFTNLASAALAPLFKPATTGADGRFTIHGVGRERVARLRIEGPTIATQVVKAMTRAAEKKPQGPHGVPFDLVALPTKPVEGVVRDKDTGKPLAGVIVRSYKVGGADDFNKLSWCTSDKEGRYLLTGLPKGDGNVIIAEAYGREPRPEDLPYLAVIRKVDDTHGLEPVTLDIPMKRGIWIKGRVIDKATGKTMMAGFDYFCFGDNPFARDLPLLNFVPQDFTRKDGSFRTVALPGRGLIAVRANTDKYRMAVGAEKLNDKVEGGQLVNTLPYHLYPGNFHTIVEVSPKEGDEAISCDVYLDPGRTLQGTALDPDGKPLAGVRVLGLRPMAYWENEPLKSADFTMVGLGAEEKRTLQVIHEQKKLAGWREVRGDEKGPVRVQLEPWGTVTGRLVTAEGEPVTDANIYAGSRQGRPDKDGKFRIDGLAPGLKFGLNAIKSPYLLQILSKNASDLTIKPGETKDLGDVQVKRPE